MGVVNLVSGKPTLCLTGGAAARLADMTPEGHIAVIHLTLTDEYPMAQAQVIIEAILGELAITEKPRSLPTSTPGGLVNIN
jgi:holo-[acyl-carrier protein] synthase